MKFQHKKWLVAVCLPMLLTACREEMTYSYLVTHPSALREKIRECQAVDDKVASELRSCEIVASAASAFAAILSEQEADPERFGAKLLENQTLFAELNQQRHRAEQQLQSLKDKHADVHDIERAQAAWEVINKQYNDLSIQLKADLAVISLSSPE